MRTVSWEEVFERLDPIDKPGNVVYGVPKGGMVAASFLKRAVVTHDPAQANVILDDLVDSGATKAKYQAKFPQAQFYALFTKQSGDGWWEFPWERDHPNKDGSIQENITRILQFIGDDPMREGLLDTPNRVIRAYKNEIFSGYNKDLKDLFVTFDNAGYDQIIILRNIEMSSMCEHHMLPFYGVAHVAYIPNDRVVGLSKLARLVDLYSRRLQIQERIGEQVTEALMEHLQPLGAACIIDAVHLCMRMRGVSKQNSSMVTSSLKGVFRTDEKARQELLNLIGMGSK